MSLLDYPNLEQFFGCYFHQDWTEEFDDPDDAIDAYVTGVDTETKLGASNELKKLLDAYTDNQSLQQILDSLGCYYDTSADSLEVNEWLRLVLSKLEAP